LSSIGFQVLSLVVRLRKHITIRTEESGKEAEQKEAAGELDGLHIVTVLQVAKIESLVSWN